VPAYSASALAHTRKVRGLSRQDVADQLGISPYTVVDYEHGRRHPSVIRLGAFADLLGVDVGAFYGGAGDA
jgi:transcriptional regulator with XRE-family HTH domain